MTGIYPVAPKMNATKTAEQLLSKLGVSETSSFTPLWGSDFISSFHHSADLFEALLECDEWE